MGRTAENESGISEAIVFSARKNTVQPRAASNAYEDPFWSPSHLPEQCGAPFKALQCTTMKHNNEVGIRALKQYASAVVAKAAAGEVITITRRGTPVARLTPIPDSRLQELTEAGLVVPASRGTTDLPDPIVGPSLSELLAELREEERH